ncbi:outer membrane protein [Roseiarcus sp.]|uniref:outer membrane protein n=1 Tax=Roseiarcus sp. TaxID=1969460 RepID=UPI003F97469F
MRIVPLGSLLLACAGAIAGPAAAADLPNAPENYPALSPGPAQPEWNPWSGLSVGAGVSAWGGKGVKGGAGADGYIGYDHVFDNGVVVGVRAESGYGPFLWSTPRGFSQFTGTAYAGGEATVGYRMGQLTPYLIAGVDLARPTAFGSANPLDAVNAVFSGPGAVQAVGTVGMGFTYQVTPNFAVGMEARVYKANNPNNGLAPLPY